MTKNLFFSKYSGCGNDFIIIDNRRTGHSFSKEVIIQLCHRCHGIGADGVILLENPHSPDASYRMRIFNADGSEAEMCGNGIRCLAHFIRSIENSGPHFEIEIMHQLLKVSFDLDYHSPMIQISMPPPSPVIHEKVLINQREISLYCLDTGVPHAVYFSDSLEDKDFCALAYQIRSHAKFVPKGTNVNCVQIQSDQSIAIRTYERGVENETLACGTGAAASAIASAYAFSLKPSIQVHVRSGDKLIIDFKRNKHFFSELTMIGPATKTFEGKVII